MNKILFVVTSTDIEYFDTHIVGLFIEKESAEECTRIEQEKYDKEVEEGYSCYGTSVSYYPLEISDFDKVEAKNKIMRAAMFDKIKEWLNTPVYGTICHGPSGPPLIKGIDKEKA